MKIKTELLKIYVSEYINNHTEQFLSSEQLKALSESPYVEIGNHSNLIHGNSSDHVWNLYKRDAMNALNDYKTNAQIIQNITSKPVTSASYPYGIYTEYLNALMNYNGFTTYSSDEGGCVKENSPYPRYNRAKDCNIAGLMQHARSIVSYDSLLNRYQDAADITVYENGSKFTDTVFMKNDVTMLPADFLAENINAQINWIEQGNKIQIYKNNNEIILTKDSDTALINGETVDLSVHVFTSKNKLYVPTRLVAETLGAEVHWDTKHRTVLIY